MDKIDFNTYEFELVKIDGKEFLITDLRIGRHFSNVPDDIKTYSIRHTDEGGNPSTVEHGVLINHMSDLIIGKDELEIGVHGFDLKEGELLNYLNERMTYKEFKERAGLK
jgi:hypothetical protein